jgi:CDP-diglyceride synthetase
VSDAINLPMLIISIGVLALLAVTNEIGYRVGRSFGTDEPEPSRAVANTIKVSVIGLVAFLLGFAFSISSGRHDVRRQVVLEEANAAGTLYLRAGLLPAVERDRIRMAVRSTVEARLLMFDRDLADDISLCKSIDAHLAEVWAAVEAAKAKDPQAVLISQIVPAANAVIDINTTRGWAFRGHTPPAVLAVLMVCVIVSAGLIGHSFGQHRHRHTLLGLSFNLLFTLTLFLILDYDGPRFGVIRVDHTPLRELKNGFDNPSG